MVPVGRADVVGLFQEAVFFFNSGEKGGKNQVFFFLRLSSSLDLDPSLKMKKKLPPSLSLSSFSPDHAGRDRLLPGVQVDEAKHLSAVVHLGAHFLFGGRG